MYMELNHPLSSSLAADLERPAQQFLVVRLRVAELRRRELIMINLQWGPGLFSDALRLVDTFAYKENA